MADSDVEIVEANIKKPIDSVSDQRISSFLRYELTFVT